MTDAEIVPEHKETGTQHHDPLILVIHAVARTVGATLGTIASGTARILGHSADPAPSGKWLKIKRGRLKTPHHRAVSNFKTG
jgi:hypothetical protein